MNTEKKRPLEKDQTEKKKRRWGTKSRWGDTDDTEKDAVLGGLPTTIPAGLTKEQEEQYLIQLQIEEITRRLQTGELGIPPVGERSPSPEPIYDHVGKRTNTREVRTRRKLEEERHRLVQKQLALNSQYRPPTDYRPPKILYSERVFIPQDEHPDIGFIGMIIGPRGKSLRKIEQDTGANIVIRGKGSVKEGRIGTKDGKPLPGADEPLHAYITSTVEECVKKGVARIKKLIHDAINIPDEDNPWMLEQLHELAVINGTVRDNDALQKLRELRDADTIVTNKIFCQLCGGAGHIAKDCKQKRCGESVQEVLSSNQLAANNAKLDVEYMSLMAELGQGPSPPSGLVASTSSAARPQIHQQQRQPLALPAPMNSMYPNQPVVSTPPVQGVPPSLNQSNAPTPLMQVDVQPAAAAAFHQPVRQSSHFYQPPLLPPPPPPPAAHVNTMCHRLRPPHMFNSASFGGNQPATNGMPFNGPGYPSDGMQPQSAFSQQHARYPQPWQQPQAGYGPSFGGSGYSNGYY